MNSEGKRHMRKGKKKRLPKPRPHRALKCDGKMPQLCSGETAQMQRGRLIADATATRILQRAAVDGGRITDDDIIRVFRQWRFLKMTRGLMCYQRENHGCSAIHWGSCVIGAANIR